MNNRIKFLPVLLLGLTAPAAMAQQLPVMTVSMTEIDANVPNIGGVQCAPGTLGSVVSMIPVYGSNANAAGTGLTTSSPYQQLNGGNEPWGTELVLWALATGTAPASGFTYTFYVNGISIGVATPTPVFQYNYGLSWTPPQPGVYFFSVTATDGLGHTANSTAVQFYATGISIVSPQPNTVDPIGSSVVIQAATSLNIGAVSRIDFFDESGLLGSSRTYPYSIIYTPPALNPLTGLNVHFIHATSYKADGTSIAFIAPNQGIVMVAAVGPLPLCTISTPQMQLAGTPAVLTPATIPIPDYVADPQAFVPVIVDASSPQGNIQQVQLYVNGVLLGTIANYPYSFQWQPAVTGTYDVTALAYDDKNNVIASTTSSVATTTPAPTVVIVGSLPSVAITSPSDGATISGGGTGTATITASATDTNTSSLGLPIQISQVQFFQDDNSIGVATSPISPGSNLYSVTFTPKQKTDPVTGAPLPSVFTAIAADTLGFSGKSAAVTVTVNVGGASTSPIIGTLPTISITAPTDGSSVVVNTGVTLSANAAATNVPGNVSKVEFLVDNTVVDTVTAYPYNYIWTPTNLGTYTISAQVTDNVGNVKDSNQISITVTTEPPPTVSITSPSGGSTATVSASITVSANATSPSGTISSVQFFENGISISTVTAAPYTATFTPLSAGLYTFTAIATDNANETTTSAPVVIEAFPASSGLSTTSYFGQYQGLSDGGRFAFITIDGTYGTYIGHSVTGSGKETAAFYSGIPVSAGGSFAVTNLSGTVSVTGISGTLSPSRDMFIGAATQAGSVAVASGYYTGNISGQAGSQITGIVGADGEAMFYISSGSLSDVADGAVDAGGSFAITTIGNNSFTGTLDPSTGFLTGTIAGQAFTGAKVTGGTFSDGALRNISTRGQAASGANTMITGFVVGGSSPKNLLIRAVGPGLTEFGLPGAITATQLQVFSGTTLVASNTGWSSTPTNASSVTAADTAAGAFALQSGSADSALVGSFAPGSYTAQISGVNGVTGIALAEVYDLDGYTPFSANRLLNISTRGNVGAGANALIGGFSINGTSPKRLLIRGAGPSLAAFNVSGSLATPHLELFGGASGNMIRENFSWGTGNDAALVTAASTQTGAFKFASGSADSAILIVLPPGIYSAVLSGTGSATGVALVEIYEVP